MQQVWRFSQAQHECSAIVPFTNPSHWHAHNTGIDNLRALQHIITQQVLPYGFEFFTSEFEVDNRVLLLSAGKSLLSVCARRLCVCVCVLVGGGGRGE
jgi:hypothetical protein